MHPVSQPLLGKRILVLGGTGFIGRHAVAALQAAGAQVCIGSRFPQRKNISAARWVQVHFEQLLQAGHWAAHLQGVDVVINCVGILRQRRGVSYAAVHHHAPVALAQACAQAGLPYIHTSALGLHAGAQSRFLSSKWLGEQAIMASGADYCLVRPSLLDGEGGFGARWLRGLARSPVQFVPRGATGQIAALSSNDLGLAYARLASLSSLSAHREVELGGVKTYRYAEYLATLRARTLRTQAWQIPLPNWLTRIGSHLCDLFHFSPFSYGHWILLQRDNAPSPNRLPELLGRAPQSIEEIATQR